MEYIRNSITDATNYLGLTDTNTTENPTLKTQALGSGAVTASQLETRKELHEELLENGSQNLQSIKPDSSAKAGLHEELLHSNKSELLHPAETSEVRLEKEKYQPITLESHPELAYEAITEEPREETLRSRPEFQRNPLIFTPAVMSQTAPLQEDVNLTSRSQPDRLERIEKQQVVREHIHPVMKEEIQPVIYREREQLDVKQVTQMLHETQIQPTTVEERQLPAQYRENVYQNNRPVQENIVLPSRDVEQTSHTRIVHEPIVNETIRKTVVEEIQPVVERDVYQPTLVQTERPIYEKIVEAPIVTRQVIDTRELGTHTTGYSGVTEQANLGYSSSSQNYQAQPQNYQAQSQSYQAYPQNYQAQPQSYQAQSQSYQMQPSSQSTSSSSYSVGESDLLASRGYGHLASRDQQMEYLPTGQVLPAVASARPAYTYLPRGTADKRPDFIGTSSQYAVAANGGLPQKSEFVNPLLPQGNNFYPNSAPQTLQRQ